MSISRLVSCVVLVLVGVSGCGGTKSWLDPSEMAPRGSAAASRGEVAARERTFTVNHDLRVPGDVGVESEAPAPSGEAEAPAPPTAPPPPDAPPTVANARQVIYSAAYRVVVADVPGTLRSIREAAERLGGHMQEVAGTSITVRVPAAKFNEAVAYIEKSGEVVDRQLRAQDVTEEMLDLGIRLDNAEKLRQRLQEILNRSDKVEDMLKIETELARVSEQIDSIKGRIRYLESQIAMSTIRVDLNAAVPQNLPGTGPRLPFDWVSGLGEGLVAGQVEQSVRRVGLFGRGPKFKTPPGFVRYYEDSGHAEAMDATGFMIRAQNHRNVDEAPLEFWSKLVRRTLVEGRSLAVEEEETVDGKVYLLRGQREVGGKPVGYLLSLERNDRDVIVYEAWGPLERFEENWDALRASALSIEPG